MLFSVYPQEVAPKRGTNPLFIILGACGGCAILAVLGLVVLGFFGYNKAKPMMEGFVQQSQNAERFAGYLTKHQYDEAVALVEPGRYTPEDLQKMVEETEQKIGTLTQSSSLTSNAVPSGKQPSSQSLKMSFDYRLVGKKGEATMTVFFNSPDPFKPSTLIYEVDIREGVTASQEGTPSEKEGGEATGESEKTSGGNR